MCSWVQSLRQPVKYSRLVCVACSTHDFCTALGHISTLIILCVTVQLQGFFIFNIAAQIQRLSNSRQQRGRSLLLLPKTPPSLISQFDQAAPPRCAQTSSIYNGWCSWEPSVLSAFEDLCLITLVSLSSAGSSVLLCGSVFVNHCQLWDLITTRYPKIDLINHKTPVKVHGHQDLEKSKPIWQNINS